MVRTADSSSIAVTIVPARRSVAGMAIRERKKNVRNASSERTARTDDAKYKNIEALTKEDRT